MFYIDKRKDEKMWSLKKNEKIWTCPQNSLIGFAYVQAKDKNDAVSIINNETAKAYLEKQGFEIMELPEQEVLIEVPKVPQWNNRQHRDLYNRLFYQKMDRPLTKEEEAFCKTMYHMEEFACGLDG